MQQTLSTPPATARAVALFARRLPPAARRPVAQLSQPPPHGACSEGGGGEVRCNLSTQGRRSTHGEKHSPHKQRQHRMVRERYHCMILSTEGAPLMPAGGSVCRRLKSRISRRFAGVVILSGHDDAPRPFLRTPRAVHLPVAAPPSLCPVVGIVHSSCCGRAKEQRPREAF